MFAVQNQQSIGCKYLPRDLTALKSSVQLASEFLQTSLSYTGSEDPIDYIVHEIDNGKFDEVEDTNLDTQKVENGEQ